MRYYIAGGDDRDYALRMLLGIGGRGATRRDYTGVSGPLLEQTGLWEMAPVHRGSRAQM